MHKISLLIVYSFFSFLVFSQVSYTSHTTPPDFFKLVISDKKLTYRSQDEFKPNNTIELGNYYIEKSSGIPIIYSENNIAKFIFLTDGVNILLYSIDLKYENYFVHLISDKPKVDYVDLMPQWVSSPILSPTSNVNKSNFENNNLIFPKVEEPWIFGNPTDSNRVTIGYNNMLMPANGVVICNGFLSLSNPEKFKTYSRVKEIKIISEKNDYEENYTIKDDANLQFIEFERPLNSFIIEIVSVYKGNSYTALTQVLPTRIRSIGK